MSALSNWLGNTMIIERAVSCLVYVLALFIVVKWISKSNSYVTINRILNIYLVILTLMGFFFIPDSSKDLYRWLQLSHNWPQLSFLEFINNVAFKSTTPVAYIYIYLCRSTGVDGVLPALCSFLFHINIFSILKKTYKYCNVDGRSISVSLLYFMCMGRMLEAISGVRSMVAIAIIANCFIKEAFSEKLYIHTIIAEIVACLIHPLAIATYAIRLVFIVFQKSRSAIVKVITVYFAIACVLLFYRYGKFYIISTIDKAESYLSSEHYYYIWEYVIAAIMWSVSLFSLKTSKYYIMNHCNVSLKNIYTFSKILLFIDFFCIIQYSMFHRMVTFTCMIFMPLVAIAYEYAENRKYIRYIWLILYSVMLFVFLRGDLCGYKFFVL